MGYQDNYANNVANIYQNLGNAQAQARLQQGAGWANAFGQIGQLASQIPGQMQDQKNAEAQRQRMARQDEIQEWTFQQAQAGAHNQSVLAKVASASRVDGKYDYTRMMELGEQAGVPMESLTEAIGRLRHFEASDVQLQTALMQGKITRMEYEGALLENFSKEAILANFEPEAMGLIFQTAADKGMDIAPWKKVWETDPKALATEIQKQYGKPQPTREITTRNADGSETIKIVPDIPGQMFTSAAEPILDIDKAIMAARAQGNQAEVRSLLNLKARIDASTRGQEPLVAVMGDDGRPVLIRRSQAEGRAPASNRDQVRPVTSGDAGRLAELTTSLDDVDVLRNTVLPRDAEGNLTEFGTTGTMAAIGAAMPNAFTEMWGWGEDAKQRQAVIDRVKQVIGKALEGGVLRKEDEYKYTKILPIISDVSSVVETKLQGLEQAITLRRERQLEALQDAGYDVSRFTERSQGAPAGSQSGPALGETRTANGETRRWDGTSWVLVR